MGKNKGQSLIEVVFSIGLVMLVITGIVMLLVNTVGSRTKSYERIKATELSQMVMERLVLEETTNSDSFWDLGSAFWTSRLGVVGIDSSFPSYDYLITATPNATNGCTAATCMDVVVSVGWSGSPSGVRDNFNRFFNKQ